MVLRDIDRPLSVITPIEGGTRFPEILDEALAKYRTDIEYFRFLILQSKDSGQLLDAIRNPKVNKDQRMSLLKMFRRCVSLVCDTETTKKITKISTESLIEAYGASFKPIEKLQEQFQNLSNEMMASLAVLIGEYDTRGQLGYQLTGTFFDWFEQHFKATELTITGPRGAGRDIELSVVFPEFEGAYPCDFVIWRREEPIAVGFARYDSTRGGAQSDDRTGGNANKVEKAQRFHERTGKRFRLVFLADGPGLAHRDTWVEACDLDEAWNGNVRVTTLKLASDRITYKWLTS